MSELLLQNGRVNREEYRKRFPLPFVVRALDPWEAEEAKLDPHRQWWIFVEPFAYVSDRFGRIEVPAGRITDFASVLEATKGILDDDDPRMLRPSAPHDELFSMQGRLPDGRVLTFHDANELIAEAMYYTGAAAFVRATVRGVLDQFGQSHWKPKGA